MIIEGIINPHVQHLLCRVRHTNTLVIADAAFPFWPDIQTVDLTLIRGIPTIPQVLEAILPNFKAGAVGRKIILPFSERISSAAPWALSVMEVSAAR